MSDYAKYQVGQENAQPAPTDEQTIQQRDATRTPGVVRVTVGGTVETDGVQSATAGVSTAEASQAPLANLKTKLHGTPVAAEDGAKAPRDTLICLDGVWDTIGSAMDAGQVALRDGKLVILTASERQAALEAQAQSKPEEVPTEHRAVLSESTRNNLGYIQAEFGSQQVVMLAHTLAKGEAVSPAQLRAMATRSGKEPVEIVDIIDRANADFTRVTMGVLDKAGVPASLAPTFAEWASKGRTAEQYTDAFATLALTGDTRNLAALAQEFRERHAGKLKGDDFHGRSIKNAPEGTRVWKDNNTHEAMIDLPGHGTMTLQVAYSQGLIELED